MIASQKQEAIYHVWRNESSNILINAVAGSGKTTTLLQLVEYCRHRTLFVAFNKSVQEEIQTRLTDRGLKQGKAMTIHSLGLKAIKSKYGSVKINNGRY
jgi:superfamily II DNA or RNA helicase